jgi:hypothetical protein
MTAMTTITGAALQPPLSSSRLDPRKRVLGKKSSSGAEKTGQTGFKALRKESSSESTQKIEVRVTFDVKKKSGEPVEMKHVQTAFSNMTLALPRSQKTIQAIVQSQPKLVDVSYRSESSEDLGKLKRIPGLQVLKCRMCEHLDVDAIVAFSTLKELEELDISHNKGVTDGVFSHLSDIKKLKILNLSATPIRASASKK